MSRYGFIEAPREYYPVRLLCQVLGVAAKWVVAGGTAAAGNLVTLSSSNKGKYGGYSHIVDFTNRDQVQAFAFNVVLGALMDRGREVAVDIGKEKVVERAVEGLAHTSGRAQRAVLRWVQVQRVSLGLDLSLGASLESGKKKLERLWEKHNEEVKQQEEAHLARTRMPVRPVPPRSPK